MIALYPYLRRQTGPLCLAESMSLTDISLYQGLMKLSMSICHQIRYRDQSQEGNKVHSRVEISKIGRKQKAINKQQWHCKVA